MSDRELYQAVCARIHANNPYQKGLDGWQLDELQDGQPGDCDSFAYSAGLRLIAAGVDPDRLCLYAYTRYTGQGHAVLQVRNPDGSFSYLDPVRNVVGDEPDDGDGGRRKRVAWPQLFSPSSVQRAETC